jgi:glycosyltransferase involved in cell wall biosynthesis
MDQMAVDAAFPAVSIVVPVYAGAATVQDLIQRCVRLHAGHTGIPTGVLRELIFVCDEPIDDSEEILREAITCYPWVRLVSLARNSGQHLATAVGMLYSSGDWILTIDEDLQHPPELVMQALNEALQSSLDLVYIRSTDRIHTKSFYRDLTSNLSKQTVQFFTRDEYSEISSFRLIRGEVGRTVANAMDSRSYLDAALFAATSERRRRTIYALFNDTRSGSESGYNLVKLIRHYGRFITSAEFSGLQLLYSIAIIAALPLVASLIGYLFYSISQGVQKFAPGWLSLFTIGITANAFIIFFGIYSIKLLSVVFARSSGMSPFLVIDRSIDRVHLRSISSWDYSVDHSLLLNTNLTWPK